MAEKKQATQKQIENITKWQKENVRQYTIRLNRNTESDLIARLEGKGNVQGYIKELIKKDMQ